MVHFVFIACKITARYGSCSAQDCKKLQRVMNEAQSITQTSLPSIDTVYTSHCLGNAASIIKDPTHPRHTLFHLLLLEKDTKVWDNEPNDLRTASSLLASDFWMDLLCIKLIFLDTIAMTVTLHSAFSLWMICLIWEACKKQYISLYTNTCDNKSNQNYRPVSQCSLQWCESF